MRKYNIIWSPNFKRELESIYNYICNKLNAKIIADNLYNQIINQIYSLKYYPERYQKLNGEYFQKKSRSFNKSFCI